MASHVQLTLDGGEVEVSNTTGAPIGVLPELAELARAGHSPYSIARTLNARGVPTSTGRGKWWPASVAHMIDRQGWNAYMAGYRAKHGA